MGVFPENIVEKDAVVVDVVKLGLREAKYVFSDCVFGVLFNKH